jgi:hypothetical protein
MVMHGTLFVEFTNFAFDGVFGNLVPSNLNDGIASLNALGSGHPYLSKHGKVRYPHPPFYILSLNFG